MVDPMDGLISFQRAIDNNLIALTPCELSSEFVMHYDIPEVDTHRYSYAKIINGKAISIAMFVPGEPFKGLPCFNVGYAVIEEYRGNGLAKEILEKSINELKNGFGRTHIKRFYIEAMVSIKNKASQAVAAKSISENPEECTDSVSGQPAISYIRLIDTTK